LCIIDINIKPDGTPAITNSIQNLVYDDENAILYILDSGDQVYSYMALEEPAFPTSMSGFARVQWIGVLDYNSKNHTTPQGNPKTWWIYIGTGVGIALVLMIVIGIYLTRRRKRRDKFVYQSLQEASYLRHSENAESTLQSLRNDNEIPKIALSDITFGSVIGSGGQGMVLKGMLKGEPVAIKNCPISAIEMLSNFAKEIKLTSLLKHPNIVEFKGMIISDSSITQIYLVTELMDFDLKCVIPKLSREEKIRISLDIARGMKYIHANELLHRDLKPANVLINKKGQCKIADFGLTRIFPDLTSTLTEHVGTILYCAPEVISCQKYDTKADVWSFGIMLIEIFSGAHPFRGTIQWVHQYHKEIASNTLNVTIPSGADCCDQIQEVMKQCTEPEPEKRPTFSEIVKILKNMKQEFSSLV